MENVFDPDHQNRHLGEKIVAGLERLATLNRSLLWQEAQRRKLSPIQLQILTFLQGHPQLQVTVTMLAREFQLTKPTVSDAIKSLESKALIARQADPRDARLLYLSITAAGRGLVLESADYLAPVVSAFDARSAADLVTAWKVISTVIHALIESQVIPMQRMCFTCRHYSWNGTEHYCALLKLVLHEAQIRLDCPEHEVLVNA